MGDRSPAEDKYGITFSSNVELANYLYNLLRGIKSSIERATPIHKTNAAAHPLLQIMEDQTDSLEISIRRSALLGLEEVMLDLRDARLTSLERTLLPLPTRETLLIPAVQNAGVLIRELLADQGILEMAERTQFRASFLKRSLKLRARVSTIKHAFLLALNIVDHIKIELGISQTSSVQELRDLVPRQKVSPVQFSGENGKLTVIKQPALSDQDDADNAQHSRNALLSKGNTLVEELQRSNCDRRLLQSVAELQQSLESCENIIRLGLMNIGVEAMCGAFEAELPDALRGMMLGHTRGIAMYVAQFPDWQKFSEKAASVELTTDDTRSVSETAKKLIAALEQHPEITDEEVPKTIRALQEFIENPALASKRATYAVLRTIENLVAKTLEYCTDLLDKTATKTVECLSGATSKAIVGTLMAMALTGALGLSPLSAKITDTAWVKAAAEFVEKQIEALVGK